MRTALIAVILVLCACRKEKAMRIEAHVSCDDCYMQWSDMKGVHRVYVKGSHVVTFEIPEDRPTFASVCALYPDSLPIAAVWMKRDGVPWGFAACVPYVDHCVSVSH